MKKNKTIFFPYKTLRCDYNSILNGKINLLIECGLFFFFFKYVAKATCRIGEEWPERGV